MPHKQSRIVRAKEGDKKGRVILKWDSNEKHRQVPAIKLSRQKKAAMKEIDENPAQKALRHGLYLGHRIKSSIILYLYFIIIFLRKCRQYFSYSCRLQLILVVINSVNQKHYVKYGGFQLFFSRFTK